MSRRARVERCCHAPHVAVRPTCQHREPKEKSIRSVNEAFDPHTVTRALSNFSLGGAHVENKARRCALTRFWWGPRGARTMEGRLSLTAVMTALSTRFVLPLLLCWGDRRKVCGGVWVLDFVGLFGLWYENCRHGPGSSPREMDRYFLNWSHRIRRLLQSLACCDAATCRGGFNGSCAGHRKGISDGFKIERNKSTCVSI